MTKFEFLAALERELKDIPTADRKRFLDYYAEMIEDRIEENGNEEAAVAEFGDPLTVAEQIRAEMNAEGTSQSTSPMPQKERPPKHTWKPLWIVLLVLGAPLWISLLAAGFVILLSVYIVLWSVAITLWAVVVSLGAVCVAGILSCSLLIVSGNAATGVLLLGGGLICGGLAIFGSLGCVQASRGLAVLSKSIFLCIKRMLVGKEKRA